jgi:hypothetical protein
METVGSKREVYKGKAKHTSGGLEKKDIVKRNGKYMSKKKLKASKSNKGLRNWISAVKKARKELKITGFVPIKKGTELYKLAKKYHNEVKSKSKSKSNKKNKGVKRNKKATKAKKSVVEMFNSMFSK